MKHFILSAILALFTLTAPAAYATENFTGDNQDYDTDGFGSSYFYQTEHAGFTDTLAPMASVDPNTFDPKSLNEIAPAAGEEELPVQDTPTDIPVSGTEAQKKAE